jgi:hypothetical protein
VNVSTDDCNVSTLPAGASCHLTYTLDTSKYISGAPKEQISYTNGTALMGKTVDSYYVYTISPKPPVIPKFNVKTSQGTYAAVGNLTPTQFFSINITLSGYSGLSDQRISGSSSVLEAAGIILVSSDGTGPNCSLNSKVTSCSLYVIVSNIALLKNSYTVHLASLNPIEIDHPDISFNVVAAPSAPGITIRLPQTGQTKRYALFDDGTYLMGESWAKSATGTTTPAQRFMADPQDANCIIDNLTGLEWPKNGIIGFATTSGGTPIAQPVYTNTTLNLNYMNWSNALTAVANMNSAPAKLCGYDDWHLPTVNELSSMVNYGAENPLQLLNTQGFSNVQAVYWSSSAYAADPGGAFYVNFNYSTINIFSKHYFSGVWPVRPSTFQATATAQVPVTGGVSAVAGSNSGVKWPSTRFVAGTGAESNCITDKLTGLMWSKNGAIGFAKTSGGALLPQPDYDNTTANRNQITWGNALTAVTNMNSARIKLCGYSDWRLPNIVELKSMINYGQPHPATWLNNTQQGFNNVQAAYWSSTSYAPNTTSACGVNFDYGNVDANH